MTIENTSRVVAATFVVLALVAASCGGGSGDDGDGGAAGTDTSTTTDPDPPPTEDAEDSDDGADAPAPPIESPFATIETFETVDGETVEEEVVPIDLLAAVEAGVDAGMWTEAEGITRALEGIIGRGEPPPGLDARTVTEPGLTALVRHASDLLAAGSVPPDEAEALSAVLAFFSPTQEVLDRISRPAADRPSDDSSTEEDDEEDASGVPPDGVQLISAPAQDTPVGPQCEAVASMGFSSDLDTGGNCYLYEEDVVDGNRLRVYYPSSWTDDEAKMGLVSVTFVGLVRSTIVFAELARVGDVNAVFSLTDSPGGTTNAAQNYFDLAGACPVTIYPAGTGQDTGDYLQTIAHETFHCVQDRNFTTAPYGTHKWWLEGSAVYFGNAVYPRNNKEHLRTPTFDRNSLTKPPTRMSYENTVFFQYYANRRGNPATIDLLRTVAANGATVQALAGVDGMADLWQDFIVAFMADAVRDTGGGTVGGAVKTTRRYDITEVDQINMDVEPMVGTRFLLDYEKEKRFVQEYTEELPPHASVEKRRQTDTSAWTDLPDEIRSECEEPARHILVSTAADRALTFVLDVNEVEEAVCDPCLLGAWDMQLDTFETFMGEVFSSLGGGGALELEIGGNYYFEFDDEGSLDATRRELSIGVTMGGFTMPAPEITGVDKGEYTTDGENLTVTGLSGFAEVSIGDVPLARSIIDPSGGTAEYECDEDELTIIDASYGPLTFDRIDEIPEPDRVEVEEGSPREGG